VLKSLVAIVADRTGYPADMIALDADIEADLGIDSIKRVEILGALQRSLPATASQGVQENMERLTRARTLRDIAAAVPGQAQAPAASLPRAEKTTPAVDVLKSLVAIVADRTGYPADMIALDADIEADLGIDSIKRVEILGALQRSLPGTASQGVQENMERLTRARTLRDMAAAAEGAASKSPAPAASAPPAEAIANPGNGIPARFLVRAVEAPAVPGEPLRLAGARLLITDDGRGVADSLADLLRARGAQVVIAARTADLADPAGAAILLERFRAAHGPLTGLVHLLPLGGRAGLDLTDLTTFKRRIALEVSGLFHLARAAAADLRAAAGSGLVAAATGRGGRFGLGETAFFPGGAGVAGFLKTLALEWAGTRVKSVDCDPDGAPAELAARLLEEIVAGDPEVEVGFRGERRHILRPVEAPLAATATAPPLGEEPIILVTGGARGITAEAAIELGRRHRPVIVLVGRTPAPAPEEAPDSAGITATDALRTALLARLRGGGAVPTPAAVERALQHLHAERDMRRTLAALDAAGARVRYVVCDVRDPAAFGDLIDAVYAEHGRIDGVVHGAGLIEDRLVADKDPASFERVFGTKVDAAFVLASRLRLADLKFFAAFTSVAGRFGNRGQADYAAANETVAAILANLDGSTPARLAALHWGPWDGTGMASPEVRRQFAVRGVGLVAPAAGARACAEEIAFGRKGEVDVILGEGPWRRYAVPPERAAASAPGARPLPFLGLEPLSPAPGGGIQFDRLLDPARDRYLDDHRLDGKPVFPAACAMELMAETAQRGWPEYEVLSIEEFRVVKGIVLDDGPRTVRVTARPETQPEAERLEVAIDVALVDPGSGRPFYRGTLRLGERLPESLPLPYDVLRAPRPFSKTVEGAYADWLFHGPLFQGLLSIDRVGEDGIAGLIAPSDPERCIAGSRGSAWIVDPIVIDSAFQLGILYARSQYDTTPLPARFRRFRRFAPLDRGPIRCEFRSRAVASDSVLEIQIALLDERGRLLGLIEDMELSCSRDLNRLAGRK
jgi:NAD(P)-dependent dehydrogenase (short-subunit alcohol dehydrogenase family)/acyl carrier protein